MESENIVGGGKKAPINKEEAEREELAASYSFKKCGNCFNYLLIDKYLCILYGNLYICYI